MEKLGTILENADQVHKNEDRLEGELWLGIARGNMRMMLIVQGQFRDFLSTLSLYVILP